MGYQRFFDFFHDEHGLILLQSEMNDIIQEALLSAKKNDIELLIREPENCYPKYIENGNDNDSAGSNSSK